MKLLRLLRLFHAASLVHKLEAVFVTVATTAAASGLRGFEPGIPLDKIGMWADLGAGLIFAGHQIHSKLRKEHTHD